MERSPAEFEQPGAVGTRVRAPALAVAAGLEALAVPDPHDALARLLPLPQRVEAAAGERFTFTPQTAIVAGDNQPLVMSIATQLVAFVRRATGVAPPILVGRARATYFMRS